MGPGCGLGGITPAKPIPSAGYHEGPVNVAIEEFCTGRVTRGFGHDARLEYLLGERDLSMRTKKSGRTNSRLKLSINNHHTKPTKRTQQRTQEEEQRESKGGKERGEREATQERTEEKRRKRKRRNVVVVVVVVVAVSGLLGRCGQPNILPPCYLRTTSASVIGCSPAQVLELGTGHPQCSTMISPGTHPTCRTKPKHPVGQGKHSARTQRDATHQYRLGGAASEAISLPASCECSRRKRRNKERTKQRERKQKAKNKPIPSQTWQFRKDSEACCITNQPWKIDQTSAPVSYTRGKTHPKNPFLKTKSALNTSK